tara:strand:+ start:283 stop:690 length:408 start_codon:yes stop_codon:yes gene_type:complete
MVLYATDANTGEAVKVFATNNQLQTTGSGGGGGGGSKTNGSLNTTVPANSLSSDNIDCRNKNNIRIYGSSNQNTLVNISFSNDNTTYKNVNLALNKVVINSVNTFEIELTNIPDYIKFYNDNATADTLDLYYVLF